MTKKRTPPNKPTGIEPQDGSLVHTLLRMPIMGEHAVIEHLDPHESLTPEVLSRIKSSINSKVTKAISRVKKAIDAEYQVEGAVFSTTRNRLYAAIIVTRTA